jgi:RNA polymerase sigma-70 factor (ECF subfamily)
MGDETAFGKYYESTIDWLVELIRRITKNVEEARNIAHDTFVKLWLQREQIDPALSLDGFVSRVATNAALNYWKNRQVHARYHREQLLTRDEEEGSPDENIIFQQTLKRIEEAIAQMPPKRKEAYQLYRIHNLTNKKIAEQMGLSVQTVKMHIRLARQTLKKVVFFLFLFLID